MRAPLPEDGTSRLLSYVTDMLVPVLTPDDGESIGFG